MRVSRNNVFTLSQLLADRENRDQEWVDNDDYKDAMDIGLWLPEPMPIFDD
ncbi:hypothetical protein CBOM_00026 [Ceraceosorus bombacis]|uniref:Uncharacterized protein n=1 Tax=Ceraceosorus bombacis TaxID=401625 RepID=A0A0P1A4D3_9BASI|nr:hypothetical protein CBOM_00026 [Ceraceosorus bombacis]